jgi:alkylation response protein AidB-like acyl-CoA dehydrogenase
MCFDFTEEQLQFRQEVSDFCQKARGFPLADFTGEAFFSPEVYREIAARGWIGLHWPKEYGLL